MTIEFVATILEFYDHPLVTTKIAGTKGSMQNTSTTVCNRAVHFHHHRLCNLTFASNLRENQAIFNATFT